MLNIFVFVLYSFCVILPFGSFFLLILGLLFQGMAGWTILTRVNTYLTNNFVFSN